MSKWFGTWDLEHWILFGICYLILGALPAFAQDTTDNSDIEQRIENVAESMNAEEGDYTQLVEQLEYFKSHPINLNSASKEELEQLQLLDDIQISNLLKHIEKNGKLIAIYELQSIDGFDLQTIEKIRPYIKVSDSFESPHFTFKEMMKYGRHSLTLRTSQVLEQQKGYLPPDSTSTANSRYLGTPPKIFARYKFSYGTHVSLGITGEKDPGEELFTGTQKKGFDFYSAHLYIHNVGFVKTLALGDYQAMFGQGLITWSALAFSKTADATLVRRYSQGIRPYTSTDENAFMRGAALTLGTKSFAVTAFYSKHGIDANISDTASTGEVKAVSSLETTGEHATAAEMADRHAVDQTIFGGNISYNRNRFHIGATGMNTLLGAPLNRSLSLYNQYEFSSASSISNGSVDYNITWKNFNFFGEGAVSDNGGMAYLNGVLAALDPRVSVTLLHRSYQRNFQSLTGNAFSESSGNANEQGFYLGLRTVLTRSLVLNAYADRFIFPWLKYQVNAPSYGSDYLGQLNYTPSKKMDMYFRVHAKDKFKNHNVTDLIDYIVPVRQVNYRYNIAFRITDAVKLTDRVEIVNYKNENGETENGYLVYQDITYKKLGSKLSFTARYALFDTKSYDSRIYAFETDVPGSFTIPSYYYKGSRAYLLVSYDIGRNVEIWARIAQTYYSNQNVISAGSLSEIQGNTKTEVRFQVRVRF